MKCNKWITLGLGMALLLTMAACSSEQEPEETASPSPDPTNTPVQEEVTESPADTAEPEATLTMTASFQDEAGAALADTTIRFTAGDTEAEYLTAEDGTLTVASLPAQGTLEVAVLDLDGETTGTAALEFSQGSVTDVTEGEDGTAAVTLLSGTDEIALNFVLMDDGTLTCALDLGGEA